jgi:hypothetical protein
MYREKERKACIDKSNKDTCVGTNDNRKKSFKRNLIIVSLCNDVFISFWTGHVLNNTFIILIFFHFYRIMQSILCCYYVVILDASGSSKLKKKPRRRIKKKKMNSRTHLAINIQIEKIDMRRHPIHIFITQSRKRKQNKSMC